MSQDPETLEDIGTELEGCEACTMCKDRESIFVGEGKADADIMFVGGTPKATHDSSGALLTKLLAKLEVSREDVYTTSLVKCDGREPKRLETATCSKFLRRQIDAVKPSVIVALGRSSANYLAKQFNLSLSALREEGWTYEGETHRAWMVPTYHPSWLLHQRGEEKAPALRTVLLDLKRAISLVGEEVPAAEVEEDLEIDFATAYEPESNVAEAGA